jgi:anti-anti-sigma factor
MSMTREDGVEAFDEHVAGAVAVVALSGELDVADPEWSDDIEAALEAGHNCLVVDLTNVTFVDSSVVRSIVLAYKRVTAAGGWVRVVYTHHLIARVIQICGLADTFPQYATVDAALRSAPSRSAGHRAEPLREASAPDIELVRTPGAEENHDSE